MRTVLLVVLVALSTLARADEGFSMSDLESLDKQESWHELLAHASDVPPSKRTDKWNQMIERAALGVLASHAGEVDTAWTFSDAVLRQYPQLKKSKSFLAKRGEVAVRGLEACLGKYDISPCENRAVAFVEGDASDPDNGFTLAKMIARKIPAAALKVWKRVLAARHTAKDCAEDLLGKSVADALSLAPEDTRVAEARTVASDVCWDGVKNILVDRFIAGDKNFRRNACPFLLTKKDALSPMSKRQCEALK